MVQRINGLGDVGACPWHSGAPAPDAPTTAQVCTSVLRRAGVSAQRAVKGARGTGHAERRPRPGQRILGQRERARRLGQNDRLGEGSELLIPEKPTL